MTLEKKSKFADRLGINKSHLSRGKALEWLVMEGDLVNVEESLRRRELFASPNPHHQAHARQLEEQRAAKSSGEGERAAPAAGGQGDAPKGEDKPKEDIEALNLRLKRAEADKREHEAEISRMERDEKAGNLIRREDVEFALDDFGATLRSLMENFADRLAPVVHPLQSMEETHAALAEAANDVLQTMNESLLKRAQEHRA